MSAVWVENQKHVFLGKIIYLQSILVSDCLNMGALTSRQNAGVEEADVVSNHAYKYPPRSGKCVLLLY